MAIMWWMYIINWICKLKPCDSRNAIIKQNLQDAKEELPVQEHVNMSNINVLRKWPVLRKRLDLRNSLILRILTCARAITLINLRMGNSLILRMCNRPILRFRNGPFAKLNSFLPGVGHSQDVGGWLQFPPLRLSEAFQNRRPHPSVHALQATFSAHNTTTNRIREVKRADQ